MVSPGDKEFLEDKKKKFLLAVEESAEYLRYSTPKVKFWKSYDSNHFNKGETAHIHIESNTICIAETELRGKTYEDIEEIASHEVSHLKELSHNDSFQATQMSTQTGLWREPTGEGLVYIREGIKSKNTKKGKPKKERPIKSRCNYHICGKRVDTNQCSYCKKYFCDEHIKPREPNLSSPNISYDDSTHPCFGYSRYLVEEKKKQEEDYAKKLNEMFGSRRKKAIDTQSEEEITFTTTKKYSKTKSKAKKKSKLFGFLKSLFRKS